MYVHGSLPSPAGPTPVSWRLASLATILGLLLSVTAVAQEPTFVAFESGPVRPLALSPDGARLYVVNVPDGRLEIVALDDGPRLVASVPVGLEPVAVAVRGDEVWVVNHLSDSVSIVDVAADPPRVTRTLLVGDEPRDVVFAGPGDRHAFVTTARRGQHRTHPSLTGVPGAGDPLLTTPGVGRADVWVFDAEALGDALGGKPLRIVSLFADTPRALARSPDGATVYVAAFLSGNGTTTVPERAVCDGFRPTDLADACPDELPGVPGGNPGPAANAAGAPAPEVGLIVRRDPLSPPPGAWRDELGRDWSAAIRFDLPDRDVFALDAATLEPAGVWSGVGTVLFAIAVHPATGALFVANTEARNEVRFEGPGRHAASTVRGHLHETRITVVDGDDVAPRHLNKHLDYRRPGNGREARHSLATPVALAISGDGETVYVAAFGSRKIGVFATAELTDDSFDPVRAGDGHFELEGGGPCGLALDETRGRLYVLTRFDNAVVALDLADGRELARIPLANPEPAALVEGRPFLYDATRTSSNGEASCSSCHVFADFDGLAWDLGDPDGVVTRSPIDILREDEARGFDPPINGSGEPSDLHPMKGPMVTQTLRGLASSGALHWRGDRATGFFGDDPLDPDLSFRNFIVAFSGLLGLRGRIATTEMESFSRFVLQLVPPPNPIRALDNRLTPDQRAGRALFEARLVDGGVGDRRCQACHALDPQLGQYGTTGRQSFMAESQIFKVPHLRGLYQKVGMFGMAAIDFLRPGGDHRHQGEQVRGFGFLHDGSIDTLFRFFQARVFNVDPAGIAGFRDDLERRQVESFLLAFDTDLAPIVGQQTTLAATLPGGVDPVAARARVELLIARAGAPFASRVLGGQSRECELVVKGIVAGVPRGFLYDPVDGHFVADRETEPRLEPDRLLALAEVPGQALTFTCVPPGSGPRLALDRDLDGALDGDELAAGSDPADPASVPHPAPEIVLDPVRRDFGEVTIGTAAVRPVRIENAGTSDLQILGFELAGDDPAVFALPSAGRDACSGRVLPPGATCHLWLRFFPTRTGVTRAVLRVLSDDPDGVAQAVLIGRGSAGGG